MAEQYKTFNPELPRNLSESSDGNSSLNREVDIFHATVRTRDSPFGKLRVLSDLETIEIVFLIVVSLSILATIALTIYRLTDIIDTTDSTFAILLLVNTVFGIAYIFHGVFGERPYELWAFMAAVVIITLYCIIDFVTNTRNTVKIIRLVVVAVFAPIIFGLSFNISMQHYTSKNLIIRTLRSAKITFQNMCLNMFLFQALLKFDVQTGISVVVLVLTSGVEQASTGEIIILVVGIVVEVIWFVVGYLLPKHEQIAHVYVFLVLSIPHPVYVVYKIWKVSTKWNKIDSRAVKGSLIACACLFLATRCVVSYFLWIVVNNFGKGLKEAVYSHEENPSEAVAESKAEKSDGDYDDYLGENVNYDVHN